MHRAIDRDAYARDGFLVVDGLLDRDRCRRLCARAEAIVDAFDPGERRSIFTTKEQARQSDEAFLASAAGIHCFFEEDAFDAEGRLRQEKAASINKIGHAVHDLDPEFEAVSYDPELAAIAAAIGLREPLALQSMVIFKQPRIGGEVSCHQDATFLYTDPITVTGLWIALEDARIDNGCLWVAPGSHRGPLRQRFVRGPAGMTFETLDPTPLPRPPDELVPVEVDAGALVILHGLLAHWSDQNRSPRRRLAYSLHCVEADAAYPAWNWLQRGPSLPLRRLDRRDGCASAHARA
ncbi:MAG: phytanoyl-CoA dioxygenase family protein [Nannocystaceae bacterium]